MFGRFGRWGWGVMAAVWMMGCAERYTPRPHAYPRVEYPPKAYARVSAGPCPFSMELPGYARLVPDTSAGAEPCWFNVYFAPYGSKLHLTYKPVAADSQLYAYVRDAFEFVYKHTVKALRIDERTVARPPDSVFGMYFYLEGNTATAIQFFLTDSTRHYLRGALYFETRVRRDSLQPIIEFLDQDVHRIIETLRWAQPSGDE